MSGPKETESRQNSPSLQACYKNDISDTAEHNGEMSSEKIMFFKREHPLREVKLESRNAPSILSGPALLDKQPLRR